jgi:hypothetical protein
MQNRYLLCTFLWKTNPKQVAGLKAVREIVGSASAAGRFDGASAVLVSNRLPRGLITTAGGRRAKRPSAWLTRRTD